jgi:hypothetical protein
LRLLGKIGAVSHRSGKQSFEVQCRRLAAAIKPIS